jgi:hypothetical protein
MKKLTSFILVLSLFLASATVDAQKLKLTKGSDLSFMKGTTKILVKYTYDNMSVGKMTEEAYLEKRSKELDEKEPGRGDIWKKKWTEDRQQRFEPKFEELFNKVIGKKGVAAGSQFSDAEYVVEVKTTWTEPGYYVGVSSRPAFITGVVVITKNGDPSNELAVIEFINAPGNSVGASWDTGERIKESYAKLGKSLGAFMIKKKAF